MQEPLLQFLRLKSGLEVSIYIYIYIYTPVFKKVFIQRDI